MTALSPEGARFGKNGCSVFGMWIRSNPHLSLQGFPLPLSLSPSLVIQLQRFPLTLFFFLSHVRVCNLLECTNSVLKQIGQRAYNSPRNLPVTKLHTSCSINFVRYPYYLIREHLYSVKAIT